MFYVLQNESVAARRRVPILLTDAATGTTAQAGVALTAIYAYVNSNGGAFSGGAGTVANSGFGQYYYEFDPGEIGTLGLAGIHITAAACRDYDAIAQIAAFNLYSASTGASAYAVAQEVWTYDYITPGVVAQSAAERLEDTRTNTYTIDGNTSSIPTTSDIWSYDISFNGDPSAGFNLYQLGIGATGYAGSGLTAGDVWEYDISAISTAGTAGSQLNLSATSSGGSGLSAYDVWAFDYINAPGGVVPVSAAERLEETRTEAYAASNNTVSIPSTSDIWNYDISFNTDPSAGFNLYQLGIGATGYAGVALTSGDVWSYVDRTITGGAVTSVTDPVNVSSSSMSGIANTVWSTLTAPYTTHATFGHQVLRSDNAATIGEVTLHQSGGSKRVDADVHAFVNNTASATAILNILTGIGSSITGNITGNLSGSVGSVVNPVNVSTSSMTGIAGTVWSTDISGYTSPSAGFDLANASSGSGISAADVWDFVITGFGQTGSAALYTTQTNFTVGNIESYVQTQTPQDVWTYAGVEGRTITGGAVSSVLDPVIFSSSQYSAIASSVWNAGTRTITGGIADTVSNVTGNVSGSVGSVLGNVSGNVVGSVGSVTGNVAGSVGSVTGNVAGSVNSVITPVSLDTSSMTGIAGTVWSTDISGYTSPSAGFDLANASSGSGISAYDVWNFDPTAMTSPQAGAILTDIQTDTNTIITDIGNVPNNVWASDVSGYVNPGEAGFNLYQLGIGATGYSAGSALTAGDVWDYASRTITGGIADTVTTVSGNVLGSVNSVVNDVTISTGTQASIANSVWSFDISTGPASPSASYYINNINTEAQSAATDASTAASNTNDIGGTVWASDVTGYVTPGEAGFELTQAASGAGLTSGDVSVAVWDADPVNYSNNSTFGKGILRSDNAGIAGTVTLWSGAAYNGIYADAYRIDGDYGAATALKNVLTGIGSSITGNITGDVSGSVGSVTADVNVTTDSMTGIAGTVWTYATRTLTSSGSGISAYDVWNFVLSDANTAEVDLVQAAAGSGLTAGDVWSAPSRTITGGIADTVSNVTGNVSGSVGSVLGNVSGNVVGTVGSVTGNVSGNVVGSVGSVTGNVAGTVAAVTGNVSGNVVGSVASVLGNVSGNVVGTVAAVTGNVSGNVVGSVASVLGNVSGNVVGSVGSVTGNVAGSVASVTGNVSGSVASVTGNVAGSVASVTNPVIFDSAQYASIASSVWNAATRTLTSGGAGISAYDVWNFVLSDSNTAEVDLVQAASGAGLTAGDVWTYGSRTITGGLADTVTSITNPVTVGTNNDKTGYALSAGGVTAVQSGLSTLTQAQVGTEVDSSLSDVGLTSTVTGRIDVAVSSRLASSSYETPPTAASIASSVWSAGSRTITGGTVDNLTNPATVATSSMTGIAGTVWNYSTRTITSGGGATAGDVWTYPTRSLTSGAGITVNAATNIINGPYFVKSNVDGQDGNLDVITGMVQDIQLTVTDAFGNPFDTTALGLAVNFYNQAGTLTTSYGTSELYGPAGLVQFTLDTAVTGVEGRYNLILSAAGAGNTIKFGPLTTLVRPY
jgi:uncharacterized protein YjbJ (UPF0337 family)